MTVKAPTRRIMNRLPVLIVFAILTTGCGDNAEPEALVERHDAGNDTPDDHVIDDVRSRSQSEREAAPERATQSACMTYMETMRECYTASSVSPKEPQPSTSEAAAFCSDYGPEWMAPYFVCMSDIVETLDCSLIVDWKPEIGMATAECMPLSRPQDGQVDPANDPNDISASACQAAADAAGECGAAYMAAMDMEMPEHDGEEAPACVDDVSTDAMYDCMAAAYSAGDCSTAEGMSGVSAAAMACAEAN